MLTGSHHYLSPALEKWTLSDHVARVWVSGDGQTGKQEPETRDEKASPKEHGSASQAGSQARLYVLCSLAALVGPVLFPCTRSSQSCIRPGPSDQSPGGWPGHFPEHRASVTQLLGGPTGRLLEAVGLVTLFSLPCHFSPTQVLPKGQGTVSPC